MNFTFNKDHVRGNIFLHFGDIRTLDLPNILEALLLVSDFSNVIDLFCFKQFMKDEDLDATFQLTEIDFYESVRAPIFISKDPSECIKNRDWC